MHQIDGFAAIAFCILYRHRETPAGSNVDNDMNKCVKGNQTPVGSRGAGGEENTHARAHLLMAPVKVFGSSKPLKRPTMVMEH